MWPEGKEKSLGAAISRAVSRLYLFVHYPTDVLAGVLLGCLCGVLGWLVCQRALRARK